VDTDPSRPTAHIRSDGTLDYTGIGRMSRVPAVRVGTVDQDDFSVRLQSDWTTDPAILAADLVDPVQLQEANDVLEEVGLPPARLEMADVGRGASARGIVIEFADTLDQVGGVASAVLLGCAAVKKIHQRVSRRRGRATTTSLGAAEYLAGGDLVQRSGAERIRLVGSGDVSRSPHDASFIGGDAYWIIFAADDRLHHDQVDAYARVTYVGEAPMVPPHREEPPPPPDDTEP
jgi:hypothetical protein